MKSFCPTIYFLLFILGSSFANAQVEQEDDHNIMVSVPEFAILDLEAPNGSTVSVGPKASTEAGMPVDFSREVNSDIWLNYSSVKSTQNNPTRSIKARLTNGSLPQGVLLTVVASSDAGNGDGAMGIPVGKITLSSSDQNLITAIGSSYTGDGVNNGHNLTYVLKEGSGSASYAQLDSHNPPNVQITYTITDN